MERSVSALFICLCFASCGWSQHDRLWTDRTGKFKVTASYVDQEGPTVRMRKQDASVVSVPIARLSQPDQAYLREIAEEERMNKKTDASISEQEPQTGLSVPLSPSPLEAPDVEKISDTDERKAVDDHESDREQEATAAARRDPTPGPSNSQPAGNSNPPIGMQQEARNTLIWEPFRYGLVLWAVLAVVTTTIAWIRFHRATLWLLLTLVLPGVALILLLRKEKPSAGECQTHSVLHGETNRIAKHEALLFTAKQLPRAFARSGDARIAFTFLRQARKRLAHHHDWTMCHSCADVVGASSSERLKAKLAYRWDQLLRLYPFLYVVEDALVGPQPGWEVANDAASTQLLHEVQLGGSRGLEAVDRTLTPNTYQLPVDCDRRTLQIALLTAEERYIQRATAAMIVERTKTESETRNEEAKKRLDSKGTSGLRKAGTAVLVGALTGNVAFGVAAGGSLNGKDAKKVRLEQERQRRIRQGWRQARRIDKSAARLSRRGDNLRSLVLGEGTLLPMVCKWGVFLPSLMAFVVGFGLCFLLMFLSLQWVFYPGFMLIGGAIVTVVSTIVSGVLVATLFTTRLFEVRSVLYAYPDVAAEIPTVRDNQPSLTA